MDSVDEWESSRIAYGKAGVKPHHTVEQCGQIMKMIFDSLSFEMLSQVDVYTDPDEFIGWLRQKFRFIRERGAKELRAFEVLYEPLQDRQHGRPRAVGFCAWRR